MLCEWALLALLAEAYAQDREATRFEHLAELQRVYGFRSFSAQTYREMATWLLSLALTTDNGMALVEALMQEMRDHHILIPGITRESRYIARLLREKNATG
jgi:hypothetical protein